jgi:hypothetical protein
MRQRVGQEWRINTRKPHLSMVQAVYTLFPGEKFIRSNFAFNVL